MGPEVENIKEYDQTNMVKLSGVFNVFLEAYVSMKEYSNPGSLASVSLCVKTYGEGQEKTGNDSTSYQEHFLVLDI